LNTIDGITLNIILQARFFKPLGIQVWKAKISQKLGYRFIIAMFSFAEKK